MQINQIQSNQDNQHKNLNLVIIKMTMIILKMTVKIIIMLVRVLAKIKVKKTMSEFKFSLNIIKIYNFINFLINFYIFLNK